MKRLVLMRHAQAEHAPGQAATDLFSVGDRPLSALGRAQAEAARDSLAAFKFDAAFASPTKRARETAAIVAAPRGLTVEVAPALNEVPVGKDAHGYAAVLADIVELARRLRTDPDPALENGERYLAVKGRFAAAITGILASHDCPLVVAHGLSNRVWLAELLGMPPHALFRLDQPHACINVVEFDGSRPTLVRMGA